MTIFSGSAKQEERTPVSTRFINEVLLLMDNTSQLIDESLSEPQADVEATRHT
jgi:hypothetical protein